MRGRLAIDLSGEKRWENHQYWEWVLGKTCHLQTPATHAFLAWFSTMKSFLGTRFICSLQMKWRYRSAPGSLHVSSTSHASSSMWTPDVGSSPLFPVTCPKSPAHSVKGGSVALRHRWYDRNRQNPQSAAIFSSRSSVRGYGPRLVRDSRNFAICSVVSLALVRPLLIA